LLQIILSGEIESSTKQAASIYLKRVTRGHWAPEEREEGEQPVQGLNTKYLTEPEKKVLKENIVEALIHSDTKVR
jgi:hypothetical protein